MSGVVQASSTDVCYGKKESTVARCTCLAFPNSSYRAGYFTPGRSPANLSVEKEVPLHLNSGILTPERTFGQATHGGSDDGAQ